MMEYIKQFIYIMIEFEDLILNISNMVNYINNGVVRKFWLNE